MKRKWWHDKVAYQIYPKSFFDSNGDGIGDIPGIISKLDYLKELGVDIVWISPCYPSPMADQGYDISDYYNIHPAFGTLDDMDRLLTEARKRDMYILLDLVVNHCSDEHEWFEKACADPDGKYGNFFYIEDKKKDSFPATGAAISAVPYGSLFPVILTNSTCIFSIKNSRILTGKTRKSGKKFTKISTGGWIAVSAASALMPLSILRKNSPIKIMLLTAQTDFAQLTICLQRHRAWESFWVK